MRQRKPQNRKKNRPKKRRQTKGRKCKRQYGGFLNRYDFAYAARNVVNHIAKNAPSIFKAATNDINKIAEQRSNQAISQAGQELERVLPKILLGDIEDVYQTPFRMLGHSGKKTFNNIKCEIFK